MDLFELISFYCGRDFKIVETDELCRIYTDIEAAEGELQEIHKEFNKIKHGVKNEMNKRGLKHK